MDVKEEYNRIVRGALDRLEFLKGAGVREIPSVRAEGLLAVREEVETCEKCALHKGKTGVVCGSGSSRARVVFVAGVASGERGEGVFSNDEEELFTKIVNSMGMERGEVYVSAVIKCRPGEGAMPGPSETGACLPYLERELRLISPRVVVALGKEAAGALLKEGEGFDEARGRFNSWGSSKLIATHHPRTLIDNPELKKEAWADMKKVMGELGGGK
ncbi:MAG: uracil-DNA glycosylase [Thermodesulfobacteriota bacterium]